MRRILLALAVLLCSSSACPQEPANPLFAGLVHVFHFEEAIGYRVDAITPGSTTARWTPAGTANNAAGIHGNALHVTTSTLGIDAGTEYIFPQTFTLAFWLNATSYTDCAICTPSGSPILTSPSVANGLDLYITSADTTVTFKVYPSAQAVVLPGDQLPTGSWHLVMIWFDATTTDQGIQVGTGTPATTSGGSFTRSTGATTLPWNQVFGWTTGLYDEMMIWNRVLSSSERSMLAGGEFYPFSSPATFTSSGYSNNSVVCNGIAQNLIVGSTTSPMASIRVINDSGGDAYAKFFRTGEPIVPAAASATGGYKILDGETYSRSKSSGPGYYAASVLCSSGETVRVWASPIG